MSDRSLDSLSNAATERNVIALIVKSEQAYLETLGQVVPSDFYHPLWRAIFIAASSLYGRGGKVDPVLLSDMLPSTEKGELEKLGGWSFIANLAEMPLEPENVKVEVKKLQGLSYRRKLAQAGKDIEDLAFTVQNPEKLEEQAEAALLEAHGEVGPPVVLLGSGALEWLETRAEQPAEVPGLKTGFPDLDRELQGLQPARMYVVAALKKTGKSIFLLNVAHHLATVEKKRVLYISTEHSQMDERSRLLSLDSRVWERQINNGTFTYIEDAARRAEESAVKLEDEEQVPIYFVFMPDLSFNRLRQVVKKYVKLKGVDILVFDYIKMGEDFRPGSTAYQELGKLANGLKNQIAGEFNIPVLTAAQMNRGASWMIKAGNTDIDSDNIGESYKIAMAASVTMVLRGLTADEYVALGGAVQSPRMLTIVDNRHGPIGNYSRLYELDGNTLHIRELAEPKEEDGEMESSQDNA